MSNEFGLRIKTQRKILGYSLKAISIDMGLKSSSYLSRVENGKSVLSIKMAKRLSKILGLLEEEIIHNITAIKKENLG